MAKIRSHLTFSNVVATMALFIALGGGAAAAVGGGFVAPSGAIQGCVKDGVLDIVKAGKRCPGHSTALAFNQRGIQGAQGIQGLQGIQGPQGVQGVQGVPGPLLSQLPSGKSETGAYAALTTGTAISTAIGDVISFPIPLASDPTAHLVLVGGSPTAACPGSVTAPTAAAGQLCLYEGVEQNRSTPEIVDTEDSSTGASRFGAEVYVQTGGGAGASYSIGTWAVTAP